MSAQLIRALRRRAEMLEHEAAQMDALGISETPQHARSSAPGAPEPPTFRNAHELRFLAHEFRSLADDAEAP
jgi:hypothetical protein